LFKIYKTDIQNLAVSQRRTRNKDSIIIILPKEQARAFGRDAQKPDLETALPKGASTPKRGKYERRTTEGWTTYSYSLQSEQVNSLIVYVVGRV
jgi:hypothetical protein